MCCRPEKWVFCWWRLFGSSDEADVFVTQRYYTQTPSLDPSVLEGLDPLEQYKFIVYSASPRVDSQKCLWTTAIFSYLVLTFVSLLSFFLLFPSFLPPSFQCLPSAFFLVDTNAMDLVLGPNFVHRLLAIVYSDVFSDALVSRAIQGLKEEWMKWESVCPLWPSVAHVCCTLVFSCNVLPYWRAQANSTTSFHLTKIFLFYTNISSGSTYKTTGPKRLDKCVPDLTRPEYTFSLLIDSILRNVAQALKRSSRNWNDDKHSPCWQPT